MRFVTDVKGIQMPMMYNHVKTVSRIDASTSYEFPSIYEDERSKSDAIYSNISVD